MGDYPASLPTVDHTEPVPRRIRAMLNGEVVLDTLAARYVWEWPNYPQYYIPLADVRADHLVDEDHRQRLRRGTSRRHGLRVGDSDRPSCASVYTDGTQAGFVRFDWQALDAWYEEDEQVFVHPRDPYTRVDSLRSTRTVRVELDGVLLAESSAPVLVFETGLPTRYYLDRNAVNIAALRASNTETACPYKGITSEYWSVQTATGTYPDLAWSYHFPTRELQPIAGLIAFYNEKVDISLDGVPIERPSTHFS